MGHMIEALHEVEARSCVRAVRAHVPSSWVLGLLVLVVIVPSLGNFLVIE